VGPGLLAYCLEFVNGFNDRGQRFSKSAEPVVINAADSGVSEQACQRPVNSEAEIRIAPMQHQGIGLKRENIGADRVF